MNTLNNFLELMVIFFIFIMSGCGAAGGIMVVNLLYKEWRKKDDVRNSSTDKKTSDTRRTQ